MTRKNKTALLNDLQAMFPHAQCELVHTSPFELLIAVILSAQTTDQSVNRVTPQLFRHFPTIDALAQADIKEVEKDIQTLGLFHAKAKNIVTCSQQLMQQFQGRVPSTREELMTLAGVGRKTANVVLSVIYHVPALAVDTHVERVSKRLGLVKSSANPLEVENALMKAFPKERWNQLHHQLIFLGRYQCQARLPQCETCGLQIHCTFFQKKKTDSLRKKPVK